MAPHSGGYLRVEDPSFFDDRREPTRPITRAVPFEQSLPAMQPVLVGNESESFGVGRFRRGPRITTFDRRIRVEEITPFEPISLDEVIQAMPSRFREHVRRVIAADVGVFPSKTWQHLLESIKDHHPAVAGLLEQVAAGPEFASWVAKEGVQETLALERDSIDLALTLSGFGQRSMQRWRSPQAPVHFLDAIGSMPVREDQIILNDLSVFGSWSLIKQYAGNFVTFEEEGERLTVINANRTAIESTLGVDLIYYHHRYDAYVLVQYKRMVRESESGRHRFVYRPTSDGSLDKEVERMKAVSDSARPAEGDSYRLNPGSPYFKFCRPDLSLRNNGLAKGMYVPIDYWEWYISDDVSLGPLGGRVVAYESVPRYLNNTEFVALVSNGWVGTSGLSSRKIASYIRFAVESGRSVTLAALTGDVVGNVEGSSRAPATEG